MIDPTTRISRNPDVVFRSLQEEQGGVLLHLQSGAYHGLNDVAAVIWRAIENETSFADVVAAVSAQVDDVPDSLEQDVSGFVEDLSQRELVVLTP
ncbi:MAG: PqqD family protein [Gemmatimonadaceae bacterium]